MTSPHAMPPPRAIIFDWHGTLVNTLDAMYQAIEEMLPQLEELGLIDQLVPETEASSTDDEKLIRYIRIFRKLHPQVLAERRVSRTEIFDALFGENEDARSTAHKAYNQCYRNYYGEVFPYQDGVDDYLALLKTLGIKRGVATNRSREFFDNELALVGGGGWGSLIDATRCGDDLLEPTLTQPFLEQLSLYPQDTFNRVMADLLYQPHLRPTLLQAFRNPERSDALGKAIGGLLQPA